MLKQKIKLLIIFFSCISIFTPAFAQQTVFNVPSADVTPKGRFFLEQEAQFRAWNPDAFFWGTTYSAYGIGHNTEIDVSMYNVGAPPSNNLSIGAGFKSAIPIPGLKEKYPQREYKVTVGSEMLFSLDGQGVGNWSYAHLSGRVPKANTRLTAGVSVSTKQLSGTNAVSFIAAVEQPVTKKFNLLADWFSGNEHYNGFLILGGSYALPKDTTIFAGYQIPNSPQNGVSGFVIEVAKLF